MVTANTQGVARISLTEALAVGADACDGPVDCAPMPSPFMRWAWHQAWVDSAPPHELREAFALVLYSPQGTLEALIPMSLRQMRFRRTRARALGWAIDGVGAPDHLDIPVEPGMS